MEKDMHFNQHTSKQYNADLEVLKTHVLEMGGIVEKQLAESIRSLETADSEIAAMVIRIEQQSNEYELRIDDECAKILARRQPAASDLRMILAASKIVRDLERVGDESTKIAKLAIMLSEEGESPQGYTEIRHIANQVKSMVRDALTAFARYDAELALQVARQDDVVDLEYSAAMRQLITYMMEDPRSIKRVLNVMWALRAMERVGDHASNIAEQVIYLVKGKDARHIGINEMEKLVKNPGS